MYSQNVSKTDFKEYEDKTKWFQNAIISNMETLQDWVNSIDLFCGSLSEKLDIGTHAIDSTTTRSKKGTVSSKSFSSYSKHWKSYAPEILSAEIGISWHGDGKDSIEEKTKHLVNYQTRKLGKTSKRS